MARRTREQMAQTRQSIIDAATELFAEHGFANTQIAQIADNAGIGISAFYSQFRDKEELFLLIVAQMFGEVHGNVVELRRTINVDSPVEMIMAVQRIYDMVFELLARHRQITLSVLRSGFATVPALEQLFWGICDAVAEEMLRDFERAEKQSNLLINRPRDLSDAMIGMILQLGHRMVRDDSLSPHQASSVCTKFTFGGLMMYMPSDTVRRIAPLLGAFPSEAP
jgi:AcrR family transcriptional regulator